jgi:uncharacterized protein
LLERANLKGAIFDVILMQSVICTALFYGWGFGLFGRLDRTALAGIVLAIWAFQLVLSAGWLTYFRFGPAEWLWRSLTYWRLQPMYNTPDARFSKTG